MKNKYFLALAAFALILIVATACAPITADAQAPAPTPAAATRTITATGEGKVYVTPDIAYIYIGVHTESANVATALSDNNNQAQAVANTLKELGVDPKDIQTSAFNVTPQQQFDKNGQPTQTVYVVDNTVNVTVRDLSKMGAILNGVVTSGANNITGISFDVQDKETAIAEAQKLAIQDGKSQAGDMAAAAGVSLGDLQSLNVYASSGPVPVYEGKGGANTVSIASNVPTASGQLVITMEANMVYAIK